MSDPTQDPLTDDTFLDDDAFVDGVSVRDWRALVDYASGEAPPAAAAQLERRLHTDPAFAAFAAPILAAWTVPIASVEAAIEAAPPPTIPDKAAGWAAIQHQAAILRAAHAAHASVPLVLHADTPAGGPALSPAIPSPRSPRDRLGPWGPRSWRSLHAGLFALAACLVVAVGIRIVHRRQHPGRYYHATTTPLAVTLPDGSHATLEPGAYLGTSPGFTAGPRTVYLFGAAHFTVAPDPRSPFTVHAIGLRATALGTTFDVRADTVPQFAVHVLQGKVALDLVDAWGRVQRVAVLTAGDVQHIPALSRWFLRAGYIVGNAGVPFGESLRLNDALLRAAAAVAPR